MTDKSGSLEAELEELFDIRHAKVRTEKFISQEAMAAQRDIRVITHMFRDGIPDVTIAVNDFEVIKWDSLSKRLLLVSNESTQILEATTRHTMIRMRPHLALLVKAAKEFYKN